MGESMRKQKMKKILSLLAAGVLLLMSMSGCGKEAETGKTQVAMIVKSLSLIHISEPTRH